MTTITERRLTPDSLAGLRISPIKDRPKNINLLVYGDSGIGKTVFAGSADLVPEMRPVLMVDVEGGAMSLLKFCPEVEVVRVKTWDELQELYAALYEGNHPYRTVIIDSLTEVQKFSMAQIMKDVITLDPARDPDIPSLREWGKNIEQTRRMVRAFRDLPMNAIFTSLVKEDKDSKTGTVRKEPYLSGKLSKEVAAFLDVVVYMYVKNIQKGDEIVRTRLLLTGATDSTVAKDRSGSLPLTLQEPTMRQVYDYAVAGKTPEESK